MELEICKKVGWILTTGPFSVPTNTCQNPPNSDDSLPSSHEPAYLMIKDISKPEVNHTLEKKQKLCSKFINGNLNSVFGAMTEEWDFWLNEEASKQTLPAELLSLLEQLINKQAYFRNPMRGSYIMFCEGSQAIDTILCHPKSLLFNPVYLSAASILLCLSRRLAVNTALTK